MDRDQPYAQDLPYGPNNGQWLEQTEYHSHHQPPQQEFSGFAFSAGPVPLAPLYHNPVNIPRTTHQQLQPLIVPAHGWPSMLTSQGSYSQHGLSMQPQLQPAPASASPQLSSSHSTHPTHHTPTPRRTLTDDDRRKMCMFHEEYPTKKQTEIGEMFGVERSTVSKVLRQKDKYLYQDDGSKSPLRRSKGKLPDIDRTMTNWAKKQQSNGVPLTDELIRKQALFFSATVGGRETQMKINSSSWLEKFKQKNNLGDSKSRKGSMTSPDSPTVLPANVEQESNVKEESMSPTGSSRTNSSSAVGMSKTRSQDSSGQGDVSNLRKRTPYQSQSNTSLSNAFNDTVSSNFSAASTDINTPAPSPETNTISASFFPSQPIHQSTAPRNAQRARSQTFPLAGADQYISPPPSTQSITPKHTSAAVLESPISEMPPPTSTTSASSALRLEHQEDSPLHFTAPSPPTYQSLASGTLPTPISPAPPTTDEVRHALDVVMRFFRSQPPGLMDPQESMTVGKLIERLKLYPVGDQQLPGGLHRIPEHEFGGSQMKRSAVSKREFKAEL